MVSAKLDTLDLLKIEAFSNKSYDIIIFVHDVTNKILSHESNYIVDMVTKFGISKISMREVLITSVLWGFDQKNQFFWEVLLVQGNWFRTCTRYGLENSQPCVKRFKTKGHKVLENWYGGGTFCPPLHHE